MDEREYDILFKKMDKARKYEKPYELDQGETDSLKAIAKTLKDEKYRNKERALEHFQYLEKLENKLTRIHSEEETDYFMCITRKLQI